MKNSFHRRNRIYCKIKFSGDTECIGAIASIAEIGSIGKRDAFLDSMVDTELIGNIEFTRKIEATVEVEFIGVTDFIEEITFIGEPNSRIIYPQ